MFIQLVGKNLDGIDLSRLPEPIRNMIDDVIDSKECGASHDHVYDHYSDQPAYEDVHDHWSDSD